MVCVVGCFLLMAFAAGKAKSAQSQPFRDCVYQGGPQSIRGRVQCAYYDLGGEGIAYHDTDAKNQGSGGLNPSDGSYLNQFRRNEGVDTSLYEIPAPDLTTVLTTWCLRPRVSSM